MFLVGFGRAMAAGVAGDAIEGAGCPHDYRTKKSFVPQKGEPMTTIVELLEMGLNQYNAEKVLESYSRRIGTEHGDFTVVDMTYLGNSACDVEMRCRFCGKSLHKTIYTNRSKKTKWCRVQNVCECTKQARKEDTEAKRRLAESIEVQRREEEKRSYIGRDYGEYRIVGIDGDSFVGQCKICGRTKNFKIKRIDSRRDFKCKEHRKTVEKYDETYIGQKKNHLTVIGITHDMKTGRKRFICKCDCGEKNVSKAYVLGKWTCGELRVLFGV